MIEVRGLQKFYNKKKKNEQHVLKDVSVSFPKTGLICILGESGSGKTTLLNAIGGLDDFEGGNIALQFPDKEEILLDGYNTKVFEPLRNEHFGYIFQNYYLLQEHTVFYNVRIALSSYEMPEEEKDRRCEYVIDMMGLSRYKKKPVDKLSGGQKQRVSIARALVKSPDIILADEPTGNLDEENTLRTMSILKSISKECLVILVSHERPIAEVFADRIIEIRDGQLYRDYSCEEKRAYERLDDTDLYLLDLQEQTISEKFAEFRVYTGKEEQQNLQIRLRLALKDNRIYLESLDDKEIVVCGDTSGFYMKEEHKPEFDLSDVEELEYHLEKPSVKGQAKLPFREVLAMAASNLKTFGKRQVVMLVVMLVTAVMLSLSVADLYSTLSVDEESVVGADENYVKLYFSKVTSLRDKQDQWEILEFVWDHLSDEAYGELFYQPDVALYLTGYGFEQTDDLIQRMPGLSFSDVKHLDEEALLYGRMPQKRNEVVADIRLIRRVMKSNGSVASLYKDASSYVGAVMKALDSDEKLVICGICESGQPDVFCDQNVLLGLESKSYHIAGLSQLMAEYEDDASSYTLEKGQMLMREGLYANNSILEEFQEQKLHYTIGDDITHTYEIVGTFPDSWGVDYVFTDEECTNIRDLMIYNGKTCYLYTDDAKKVCEKIAELGQDYRLSFSLEATVPYEEELLAYHEEHSVNLDAKKLIVAAILLVALVFIYFTMKGVAMSRMEDITVYRLIGIAPQSIQLSYALEMILLISITSLPTVWLVYGVMRLISQIPSLGIAIQFPAGVVLLLLLFIYVIHVLLAILPVRRILKKPPAVLSSKF